MNSDLTNIAANLTNTVLANRGEQGQRNAVLVSQHGTKIRDPGFLSNDFRRTFHAPPRLYFTAESDEFDASTLTEWQKAGFTVEYFSMGKGGASYTKKLESLFSKPLELGENFGIIGKCYNFDEGFLCFYPGVVETLDSGPETRSLSFIRLDHLAGSPTPATFLNMN